jgi:hypothetical protein
LQLQFRLTYVDVVIPDLALAFEYQGEPHFFDLPIYGSSRRRINVDKHKRVISKDGGLTLISIPFWWDHQDATLAATIQSYLSSIVKELRL